MKYFEEISNLQLSDNNLERKKKQIIQLLSEDQSESENELQLENIFSDNSLNEINILKSSHIEKIEENDK